MAAPTRWLMLAYKVPPEPAAKRIALWRKLKGLGAVYLQNGVCLIPKTAEHGRRLKVLANDVSAMGGEAFALEAAGLDKSQEERVVARFKADRDEQYMSSSAAAQTTKPRSPRSGEQTNSPMPNWTKKKRISRSCRTGWRRSGSWTSTALL